MRTVIACIVLASTAGAQAPRLTPNSTIGCESCAGPALFTGIHAISIASNGDIIVADKTSPMLRVFDPSGNPRRTFGREGAGPGELRSPIAVARTGNGGVHVVDLGRRALQRYDSLGRDLGTSALDGFPTIASFSQDGNTALLGLTGPRSPSMRIVRVGGTRTEELLQAGAAEFPLRRTEMATLSVAIAPDGSFAVGDGAGEYLIRRYAPDGKFLGEIRRTVAKVRRTPDELRAMAKRRSDELAKMQAMTGGSGATAPPSLEGIPPERNYFDPYAMKFDEMGRLWVLAQRGTPAEAVFDVFDSTGKYAGEAKLERRIKDFALGAGLLAVVAESEHGVEQIVTWKANW